MYRIRNKIYKMKKYVAVLFRRWFRFPQLWVLITLWLPAISVTRCWRALIWSIVSVVKEKIVPTAVCFATNRLLLSDRWAATVLESQFHCRYWCCQGGVLGETLLRPTRVPMRVSINKLSPFLKRIMPVLTTTFRIGWGLSSRLLHVPVKFELLMVLR